jgi:hypothetical protein
MGLQNPWLDRSANPPPVNLIGYPLPSLSSHPPFCFSFFFYYLSALVRTTVKHFKSACLLSIFAKNVHSHLQTKLQAFLSAINNPLFSEANFNKF